MMQTQTLKPGADTPTILPLAALVKLAVLTPDEQDVVDHASEPQFAKRLSVRYGLKALARALENTVYWRSVLQNDIWPMRRRAEMRLTPKQKVIAFEVEENVMESWTLATKHLETLKGLTS